MTPKQEVAKLRNAIRRAGFAVVETSGDWSIHDVSEHAKASRAQETRIIAEHIDMLAMLKKIVPAEYGCLRRWSGHTFIHDPECHDCQLAEAARQLIKRAEK